MINNIEAALESAHVQNNSISFPIEMTSPIYKKVKTMLTNIRGHYVGKGDKGLFEFPFNPKSIINKYLDNKEWPKKNPFALFPTPKCIVDYAIEHTFAGASMWSGYEVVRILEPSAGRGDFIDAIVNDFKLQGIAVDVTCAEIDPVNIEILKAKGYSVIEGDFLAIHVDSLAKFDLIIANPPYQNEKYIRHVNHAQRFLKKFGKMMAVIPTKLFSSQTKIGVELKNKVAALNIGEFGDCIFEEGTFENTKIETMLVALHSVERTEYDMKHITGYAARLMTMFLDNDKMSNTKLGRCKNVEELSGIMNYLTELYLHNSPYSFLNDEVIKLAKAEFIASLDFSDHEPVAKKIVVNPVEVVESKAKELPITYILPESIDSIQENIKTVIVSIESKLIPRTKRKAKRKANVDIVNAHQLDMFALG